MASQLLIEGTLDAKDPRGSEDRKFWKAWRRQWAKFSVVYPAGRREPYLVLTLSHNSSAVPDKEIKLSRDGLRLFRCRSKSRPYRTWSIISGNKVVLYFAAETEIQAQNWMQAVRDGLWPPCFSFQMLTACGYEVSLLDDDNTFMAGILGVYGRFVLTTGDVISLMHPHWGSTLLEISLDNIIDVLFIREAEISPAGVFSIILKRIEGSNVKALQFYCNTVKDAMQWILSKLYTRRKSFSLNGSRKLSDNRVSFSVLDDSSSSTSSLYENLDHEKTTISVDKLLVSSQTNSKSNNITDPFITTNLQPIYENMESLKTSSFKNENKYSSFSEKSDVLRGNNFEKKSQEIFCGQSRKYYFHEFSSDSKNENKSRLLDLASNDNIYENMSTGLTSLKMFCTTNDLNNLDTEPVNQKNLNKKSNSTANDLQIESVKEEFVEYAVINKSHRDNSKDLRIKHTYTTNENVYENQILGSDSFGESETFNSSEDFNNRTADISINSSSSNNTSSVNTIIEQNKTKISKNITMVNYDSKVSESSYSNNDLRSTVIKNVSNNATTEEKSFQYSVNDSFNDFRNSAQGSHRLLPNFPSNFLDTSINSLNPGNKGRGNSSSSEEDNENLLTLVNEFDVLTANDQIYEDILERKGTIYEEINESEEEYVNAPLNAPELPKRPTNLEIPESLRLHKLSRNLQQTLAVMDDKQTQKEFRHPNFIKKIKDVNRIMRLSPNQENSKEAFKVESKLKIDIGNEKVLPSKRST